MRPTSHNDSVLAALLSSIVHLSKALNLTLVVEGIETLHQLDELRPLEVALGQGYLFGKPAPLAELDFGLRRSIAEHEAASLVAYADAKQLGLPIEYLPPDDERWSRYWELYCLLRLETEEGKKIYESAYASQIV